MKKILFVLLIYPSSSTFSQSSVIEEAGYILAQQAAFGGLSYLVTKEKVYGHLLVGAIDIFFVYAGIQNGLQKEINAQQIGYYLLSTGFLAKAGYATYFGKKHSYKKRFWVNYVAYNVLVYSGYFLDSISGPPTG